MKKIFRSDFFLLFALSALAYLPFVPQFGYFNDDWYLAPTAGAQGAWYFNVIFGIDRPMRAWVMIPAYLLFGGDPLYYNVSAYVFRLISGLAFLWILRQVWKERWMALAAALLFLLYPGFLNQPNAMDYQSHIFGLAAGMTSIALTIKTVQAESLKKKAAFYLPSLALGILYLGQMEWYIGLETLRFGAILIPVLRRADSLRARLISLFKQSLVAAVSPAAFLIWRLFFFQSERGATDVDLQLSGFRAAPAAFLFQNAATFWNDALDVLLFAWRTPLQRLTVHFSNQDWLAALAVSVLALFFFWIFLQKNAASLSANFAADGRFQAAWLGLGLLAFGLLPVILVGRSVDFKSFSRYSIIAASGASILWAALLASVSNVRWRNIAFGALLLSAMLTHYANGYAYAQSAQATRNFWRQVGWRVPQLERGTTLIASYSVVAEEDYFTWGPANLIYYPGQSAHADYHQPILYAALLNEDTIEKVKARKPQEFSNRRGIRTYKNYRNILVLTQPSPDACVRAIDMRQIELSPKDDPRVAELAPYSEAEHIFYDEPPRTPPSIPFGAEPAHTWCFYYEKASLARQRNDWDEVLRLGEEARKSGYAPAEPVEWIPFLQGYVRAGNFQRAEEIAALLDPQTKARAREILLQADLTPERREWLERIFAP